MAPRAGEQGEDSVSESEPSLMDQFEGQVEGQVPQTDTTGGEFEPSVSDSDSGSVMFDETPLGEPVDIPNTEAPYIDQPQGEPSVEVTDSSEMYDQPSRYGEYDAPPPYEDVVDGVDVVDAVDGAELSVGPDGYDPINLDPVPEPAGAEWNSGQPSMEPAPGTGLADVSAELNTELNTVDLGTVEIIEPASGSGLADVSGELNAELNTVDLGAVDSVDPAADAFDPSNIESMPDPVAPEWNAGEASEIIGE